jgi:gp45 sliding clamp, C terminal
MKLSTETISVLKNFGAINQGIMFKKGKTLKTVSSHKNILAEVTIKEDIPAEFGVYDLNNFLSVVSLHKDDPSFEFDDKHVVICGNKGRSKIKYRFCEPTMIVTPPEKAISMPDAEIKFSLSAEDFDWILRAASVLSSPQIAIESDGKKVTIVTLDLQNDSAHTDSLDLTEGDGTKYRMVFKTENLTKIMPGAYEVAISSKGISHFQHKTNPLKYWITTESGSKFEKA